MRGNLFVLFFLTGTYMKLSEYLFFGVELRVFNIICITGLGLTK